MNEAFHHIRKKYIDAITGNITVGGVTIPIYNHVPSNVDTPFIKVYSYLQDEIDQNNSTYITECITRFEPIVSYFGDTGGEYELNQIVDGILSIVRTRTNVDLTAEGFNVITTTLERIKYFPPEYESGKTYFRCLLDISNRIEKI